MNESIKRRVTALEQAEGVSVPALVFKFYTWPKGEPEPPDLLTDKYFQGATVDGVKYTPEDYASWLALHGEDRAAYDGERFTAVDIGGIGPDDI